jgi:Sec-independent protein translocase protein TatA
VLGPEKLPRVVSELGRWVGRARVMARQFREQLEEEVQLEQARKTQAAAAQAAAAPPPPASHPADVAAEPRSASAETPAGTDDVARGEPVTAHPTEATGTDPTAPRAVSTPSAHERGT